ncbi:aldo/keto reductase [Curtobacterium ammoniigenes]|uniref:aldo/keto reductase n=1 Tax=Curtobacterium ammoniigenes TaxID=395387 RepID=UPI000A3EA9BE|nr:aldo/keto reductase [Curtobacterium ammoniigenes]
MTADPAEQRPLGGTDLKVSAVTLGTSNWGPLRADESPAHRDQRIADLADAFFNGTLPVSALDTSNIYGGSLAEHLIGDALERANGLKPGQLLQTKLDRRLSDGDFSAEQMRRSLDESRARLRLSHLQMLYLHDPEQIGFERAMARGGPVDALVAMRDVGITAHIGISGGPVRMLERFLRTGLFDAVVTHNRFTLLDRSADQLLDVAAERRIGVFNAAPYGGGILTGDRRFANSYGYRPLHSETAAAFHGIQRLCDEAGVSVGAAALQFSMREPRVHSTIVGASDRARWEQSVRYAAEPIPPGLWDDIEALRPSSAAALDEGASR